MPLGPSFVDALRMAAEVHDGHNRKGTEIPYIGHLLSVCALVMQAGGTQDEAVAALLHDALEDRPERISAQMIRERYGAEVLAIVQGCSDDVAPDVTDAGDPVERQRDTSNWFERKSSYLDHLATADASVLRVSCADKIDNARAIVADYRRLGEALSPRFNAGRDEQLWYYRGLARAFSDRRQDLGPDAEWLVAELEEQVETLERLAGKA